jgi:hypothetical protein
MFSIFKMAVSAILDFSKCAKIESGTGFYATEATIFQNFIKIGR